MLREELIDADRVLPLVHFDTEVFIELTVIRLLIGISIGHQIQFFII